MADDDLLASLFNNKSLIIYLKTSVVTSELISDNKIKGHYNGDRCYVI